MKFNAGILSSTFLNFFSSPLFDIREDSKFNKFCKSTESFKIS